MKCGGLGAKWKNQIKVQTVKEAGDDDHYNNDNHDDKNTIRTQDWVQLGYCIWTCQRQGNHEFSCKLHATCWLHTKKWINVMTTCILVRCAASTFANCNWQRFPRMLAGWHQNNTDFYPAREAPAHSTPTP